MANRITEEWTGKKSTKKGIRWSKCLGGEPALDQEHVTSIQAALHGAILNPVPLHPLPYDHQNIARGLVPAVQFGTVTFGPSFHSVEADSVRLRALEAKVYAMDAELRSLRADHSRRMGEHSTLGAATSRIQTILAITRSVFGKQVSRRIEQHFEPDSGDPVVTVWVGEDADVDDVTRRQIMWHEQLVEAAPDTVGSVKLIVAYE